MNQELAIQIAENLLIACGLFAAIFFGLIKSPLARAAAIKGASMYRAARAGSVSWHGAMQQARGE